MKPFLLFISILFTMNCSAQKKDNIFLTAELNKTKGLSLAYNRMLSNPKIGVGAGIEFIDISTKKFGGIMPTIDIRHYSKFRHSTIIPMAQFGYNIWNLDYQKFGSGETYAFKGGPGVSLGIGYSYSTTAKGSGPFAAIKYRSLQYKMNDPVLPKTNTTNQLKISIGWRF